MKKLVFVRHTPTEFNSNVVRLRGGLDVPLSLTGIDQIPEVVESLKKVYPTFNCIYSSPLTRALTLANSIEIAYNIPKFKHAGLSSWNYGVLNGAVVSEVIPLLNVMATGLGRKLAPENGESMREFLSRLTGTIKAIISSMPKNGTILIVTHLQNILLSREWLAQGMPKDLIAMPYKYSEDSEIAPGTWIEIPIDINKV